MNAAEWDRISLVERVVEILEALDFVTTDHFGRPFVSAYQLAIEFRLRYRQDFESTRLPLGGEGTGQHSSFSQQLARELSRRIRDGLTTEIDGAYLVQRHFVDAEFNTGDGTIHASLGNPGIFSMFRLTRPRHNAT